MTQKSAFFTSRYKNGEIRAQMCYAVKATKIRTRCRMVIPAWVYAKRLSWPLLFVQLIYIEERCGC